MGRRCLLSRWSTTVREICHASSTSDTGISARTAERIIQVDEERLTLWRDLLDRPDEPLDETPLVHAVTTAELGAMVKLAGYRTRLGDRDPRISSGYHEKGARKKGLFVKASVPLRTGPRSYCRDRTSLSRHHSRSSLRDMGRQSKVCDLTKLAANAVPTTKYRRVCDLDRYRADQDQWLDYSLAEPISRPYTDFYRLAWRRQIADNSERSLVSCLISTWPAHVHWCTAWLSSAIETALAAGFWAAIPVDYLAPRNRPRDLGVADARMMPVSDPGHPLAVLCFCARCG